VVWVKRLLLPITAPIAALIFPLNFAFWALYVHLLFVIRLLVTKKMWLRMANVLTEIVGIGYRWGNWLPMFLMPTRYVYPDLTGLNRQGWYFIISNHQSWFDILLLFATFAGRVPFTKYFIKKELMKVPLMGTSCWSLDFPIMHRYTKAYLLEHPECKGKDIERTRKSCEHFKAVPTTVVNFIEGTRFTPAKHQRQKSPYQHLLRPKAGGVAFMLSAMGDSMEKILDVTIVYQGKGPSLWYYLTGRIPKIIVDVQVRDIDKSLIGDYQNDREFRTHFQAWLNQHWQEKDALIHKLSQS